MESNVWVLIFSKFSNACKALIEMIENSEIQTSFQELCIDNKQIRNIVQGSKKFNIKTVPCILNVDRASGIVKQYEGVKAFELIQSLTPPPRVSTPPPPPVSEIEELEIKEEKQNHQSSVADDERPSMVLKTKVSAKDIMNQNVTSIDSLDDLTEKIIPPPIEQKKAGKPISVSEVMAAAQRGRA